MLGPHCEEEDPSPALVAAVVCWLCGADPLVVNHIKVFAPFKRSKIVKVVNNLNFLKH
jgi:hypothetical protein